MRVTRLTELRLENRNQRIMPAMYTHDPNVAYCIIYDYSNTMVRRQYYCGAEVKRKRKTITEMCAGTGYNMIHNKLLQFLGPSVRLPPSAAAELQMSTRRIMRGTLYVY